MKELFIYFILCLLKPLNLIINSFMQKSNQETKKLRDLFFYSQPNNLINYHVYLLKRELAIKKLQEVKLSDRKTFKSKETDNLLSYILA